MSVNDENTGKDLEALRKEFRELDKNITRLSYTRIALLFLFAFAFASASGKIESVDNAQIQAVSAQLNDGLRKNVSFHSSFEVDPGQFIGGSCPADTDAPLRDRNAPSSVQPGEYERFGPLVHQLCDLYNAAFTFPIEFFGTKIELDLRNWIYLLPILFWFSAVYLHLLRMKRRSVAWMATRLVQASSPEQITTVDRLLFSGDTSSSTAYAQIPWQFVSVFLLISTSSIFLYLAYVTAPFWTKLDSSVFYQVGHAILICAAFTGVYIKRVNRRLVAQIGGQPGCLSGVIGSYCRKYAAFLWTWLRRVKILTFIHRFPNAYLGSGTIFMFLTLALAVSVGGCQAYKGYQLVLWTRNFKWDSDNDDLYSLSAWGAHLHQGAGLVAYLMSLALAAATLVLIFISIRNAKIWQRTKLIGLMFVSSAGISGFVLSQLAYFYSMSNLVESPSLNSLRFVWILNCVAVFIVWCLFAFGVAAHNKARWPSFSLLVVLYLPLLPSVWTFYQLLKPDSDDNYYGDVVWAVAIHLLAIGYLLRLVQTSASRTAASSTQPIKNQH